jgi:hypothetical protein
VVDGIELVYQLDIPVLGELEPLIEVGWRWDVVSALVLSNGFFQSS